MNRIERLENLSAAIDEELDERTARTLASWLEIHPEDLDDFRAVATTVGLVRELPEYAPPADLQERILRAAAASAPVGASREQALEWLDKYYEGELAAPQRQVVEHYLAVDAEFAETAELHSAMLAALAEAEEEEPPADLADRIRAEVGLPVSPAAPLRRRPSRSRLISVYSRRLATLSVAAAAVFAVVHTGGRRAPVTVATAPVATAAAPAPQAVPAPPAPAVVAHVERPADDNEPIVKVAETPAPPAKVRVAEQPVKPKVNHQYADLGHRAPADPIFKNGNPTRTPRVKPDSKTTTTRSPKPRGGGAVKIHEEEGRTGLATRSGAAVDSSGHDSVLGN